jgi:hypothetical protein
MDNQIKFVLENFNISKEHLFTRRRTREYSDPRSVLYAIIHEGNVYGTRKTIITRYDFKISLSAVEHGINSAKRHYSKLIEQYRQEEIRRNRKQFA